MQLDRAESLIYVGDTHKTVELTSQLLADAGLTGNQHARCLLIRAAALRLRGFLDQALQDATAALRLLDPDTSDAKLLAQAHKQIGIPLAMRGQLTEAATHLELALASCARIGDLNLQAEIHQSLGVTSARLGRFSEAQVHYQNAAVAYQKAGRHADLATLLNNKGRLHYDMAEYSSALDSYEKSIDLARQFKYARTESMAQVNKGDALRELGEFPGALAAYQIGFDLATVAQEPRVNCCANTGLGATYRLMGQFDRAAFHLGQAIYESYRLQLGWELADARLEAGILALETDRVEDAERSLLSCKGDFERLGARQAVSRASLYLAEVFRRSGRTKDLEDVLQALDKAPQVEATDRRLLKDASAVAEALKASVPAARADGLVAELRRSVAGRPTKSAGVKRGRRSRIPGIPGPDLRMQVFSFGPCRVTVNGSPVPGGAWQSRKAQELFVLLMCRRSGATSEELLDALWPEGGPYPKREVIHNSVYRVRRALYRTCVVLENGHYGINPVDSIWFDLEEFNRLAGAAAAELYSPRKAELLSRAIDLYRGEFMAGSYSDWVLETRRQAELKYLSNLEALATLQIELGRTPEALDSVRKIEEIDPESEVARRLFLSCNRSRPVPP